MSITATDINQSIINTYVNQGITSELMKNIKSIMRSKQFSVKNVLLLLALCGLDSLKKHANNAISAVIDKGSSYLVDFFVFLKNSYLTRVSTSTSILDDNGRKHIAHEVVNIYSIEVSASFYPLLCSYLFSNDQTSFRETVHSMKEQKDSFQQKVSLYDISIPFNDHTIKVIGNIDCTYDIDANGMITNVETKEFGKVEKNMKRNSRIVYQLIKMFRLLDTNTERMYKAIVDFVDANTKSKYVHEYTDYDNADSFSALLDHMFGDGTRVYTTYKNIWNNSGGAVNIFDCAKFMNLKLIERDYAEIAVFYTMLVLLVKDHKNCFPRDYIMFTIKHNVSDNDYVRIRDETFKMTAVRTLLDKACSRGVDERIFQYFEEMNQAGRFLKSPSCDTFRYFTKVSSSSELVANIYDKNGDLLPTTRQLVMMRQFISFMNTTNFQSKESTSSVSVYEVEIKREEVVITEAQPVKTIEKVLEDGSKETSTIEAKEAVTESKMTICFNKVNSIYKPFDSLYLKEVDEFRLKSVLTAFHTKKDIYVKLGIPFKFNALLYGKAGTGKTSAIKAIGSYLQKPLYYVDLSKVETNDEVNEIFRKINQNSNSSGIIVLEDIDCMTDIVYQREESEVKNSQFTLSNLLNVLDGVATRDDMVVLMTTNHVQKLDSALIRAGRMDLSIELTECDDYQIKTIFRHIVGRELSIDSLMNFDKKVTPAQLIYLLLPYVGSTTGDGSIISEIMSRL